MITKLPNIITTWRLTTLPVHIYLGICGCYIYLVWYCLRLTPRFYPLHYVVVLLCYYHWWRPLFAVIDGICIVIASTLTMTVYDIWWLPTLIVVLENGDLYYPAVRTRFCLRCWALHLLYCLGYITVVGIVDSFSNTTRPLLIVTLQHYLRFVVKLRALPLYTILPLFWWHWFPLLAYYNRYWYRSWLFRGLLMPLFNGCWFIVDLPRWRITWHDICPLLRYYCVFCCCWCVRLVEPYVTPTMDPTLTLWPHSTLKVD